MKKAYRCRFYPTELQEELLARIFGCCRSFFRKHARYPRFKRRGQAQSCTFTKNAFTFQAKSLSLAKIGKLDIRWSRAFTGAPSFATVSKDSTGRYFISLLLEEEIAPLSFIKKEVGIDL